MATYLQFPPEQGGLRFGPFNGVVQIGSDARRCQIVLNANQGIYPLHATLAEAPGGIWHFAPTELGAKAFVIQRGSPQVWPVNGAVQVSAGDSIIVGTPGGPRLEITTDPGASHGISGPAGGGSAQAGGFLSTLGQVFGGPQNRRRSQKTMGQGVMDELARQGQARLLRQSPFREIYVLYNRARTGVLFNPVTIVGAGITVIGMLGAGTASCSGIIYAVMRKMGV